MPGRRKYYIIPIDDQGNAYLGVKSRFNPYKDGEVRYFCGDCPNIFGGNQDRGVSMRNTLCNEAREESKYKLNLDPQAQFQEIYAATEGNNSMKFYAVRGQFTYDPDAVLPSYLAGEPKYQETTGDVLIINLNSLDPNSGTSSCKTILDHMYASNQHYIRDEQSVVEFLDSHSLLAILEAAQRVRDGRL